VKDFMDVSCVVWVEAAGVPAGLDALAVRGLQSRRARRWRHEGAL